MSKKKNVRRKKSNNLLKGVAAAGAVVGGGTIFAGNNAVYAAENDQAPVGLQSQSDEQYNQMNSILNHNQHLNHRLHLILIQNRMLLAIQLLQQH